MKPLTKALDFIEFFFFPLALFIAGLTLLASFDLLLGWAIN